MKDKKFHLIIGIIAASCTSSALFDGAMAKNHSIDKDKLLMANAPGEVKTPSGLRYQDSQVGNGASPRTGQTVTVHYTGWLMTPDGKKGKKFDSDSDHPGGPFSFQLGAGQVIRGWDEGVASMKIGGKRTLIVPPQLGYGGRDVGNGLIPPNSTLIFDVELLKAQ